MYEINIINEIKDFIITGFEKRLVKEIFNFNYNGGENGDKEENNDESSNDDNNE
ncbi:MAG: hypothetical protein AB7V56_13725 [Candidatus Nitrosocosmicus sp.]